MYEALFSIQQYILSVEITSLIIRLGHSSYFSHLSYSHLFHKKKPNLKSQDKIHFFIVYYDMCQH